MFRSAYLPAQSRKYCHIELNRGHNTLRHTRPKTTAKYKKPPSNFVFNIVGLRSNAAPVVATFVCPTHCLNFLSHCTPSHQHLHVIHNSPVCGTARMRQTHVLFATCFYVQTFSTGLSRVFRATVCGYGKNYRRNLSMINENLSKRIAG